MFDAYSYVVDSILITMKNVLICFLDRSTNAAWLLSAEDTLDVNYVCKNVQYDYVSTLQFPSLSS